MTANTKRRLAGTFAFVIASGAMRPVWGQSNATITPSVSAGPVYDSNIFFTPIAEADLIWRLTCGLAGRKSTARSTFASQYRFDAEQFRDHTALTTPFARQNADAHAQWRSASLVTIALNGGYERTPTPAELNLTTGLAAGRLQAWRMSGGTDMTVRASTRTTLVTDYQFTRDVITHGGDSLTHAFRFEWDEQAGARDTLSMKYLPEVIVFGAGVQPTATWHVMAAGWTHGISRGTRLSLEGGPRLGQGVIEPYAVVTIAWKGRAADTSLTYARTTTTALGILVPIEVQSLGGRAVYQVPGAIELDVQGGLYRNVIDRDAILVYRLGGAIIRHVAGAVSVSVTAAYDRQRGRFTGVPAGLSAPGTAGIPVQRAVFAFALVVAPTVRPRTDQPGNAQTGRRP